MRLLDLHLTNFRNYRALTHQFSGAPVILLADNAQGKSNLLEAISFAATCRTTRTSSERDLLDWDAEGDDVPTCRVVAHFSGSRVNEVEVALSADLESVQRLRALSAPAAPDSGGHREPLSLRLRKRLRINGVPRRASELVGVAAIVSFDPDEVGLLAGEPSRRREFLDRAVFQLDREYFRSMQQLNKLLPQRNALLKAIAEGIATADQLEFWDDRLILSAAQITRARLRFLDSIAGRVADLHEEFAGDSDLRIEYRSTIAKYLDEPPDPEMLEAQFRKALDRMRYRETMQGVTLVGPQRDDFDVLLRGIDLHAFGSRGQQRTAALCLKLAEADALTAAFGSRPILLLDELFAELDAQRRRKMQDQIAIFEQPFITATDLDHLSPALVNAAEILRIRNGVLVAD